MELFDENEDDLTKEISNEVEISESEEPDMLKKANNLREEDVLYQVIDKGENGVYLQNTKNNVIFEEEDMPKEQQNELESDFILRYKNGEYIFEEELTDDFFNSLVSKREYEEIKNKFESESDILEIAPNTEFIIESRETDYSTLQYGDNETINVPNVLIPYFADVNAILVYEDGKFIYKKTP